ncbi:capsular biosynthesis protein [Halobacillus halophilus]|uniref:non-specific protein-tyrosine kinase n=1 Tax=Halobacillus halophilus (strain ATCC 35676 / DSM 2266 / JCM 20832 / KCTC 3685 / LMG 17431 / NBRC 102448 / NCIMB 2269) TaxID=866895 RepID=I0JRK4_HALH3|nr:CpsD/CapB family tyrosine-protein kinase [Halobacillus halophilus]ASF40748.1 capsular biosynthesis protein [Halobacillus halophilus]CCG46775.1 capsular polysaccharide biosynthesis protein,putative tyrosine-protein kinase [Halobacillus halophilus DSM 2266]
MALSKKKKNQQTSVRSIIANDNPKSPIAEQYRTIRTNLQFASVDKELETMIVTSAGPSEGKSLTTANVAVVFAQQGKKVLLVDADLRKPTVHYTFRADNTSGLSNYLVRNRSLKELAKESRVENLDLLPSGPIPPNPSELLGSTMMEKLIEEAKEHYDMIIFDTPPVLAVADSQVLSKFVDGALLVVRSKQTEQEAAGKAKEQLEQSRANILGVVLNDMDAKDSNYYYYYGN